MPRRHCLNAVAKLLALDAFAAADVVLAYCGFGSEPDTDAFVRATRASGKALALPRIDRAGDRFVLFVVGDVERDLSANAWGIREPIPGSCTPIAATDPAHRHGSANDRSGRGRVRHRPSAVASATAPSPPAPARCSRRRNSVPAAGCA
jgi:hypothetical protein